MRAKKKQKKSDGSSSSPSTPSLLCRDGLESNFKGKRILLSAADIYRGKSCPPEGEEDYLYLYTIHRVNSDCKTAVIHFSESYVRAVDPVFRDYPRTDESNDKEESIDTYSLSRFTEDHKQYNKYLAKGADVKRAEEEDESSGNQSKAIAADDLSDILAAVRSQR